MSHQNEFPSFDEHLSFLNQFILELVEKYRVWKIYSWDELENAIRPFYSPEVMDKIEAKAPGWKKMASYSRGGTVAHVSCVFLGMYMLTEFQVLSAAQQQMAKWIILFHDIDKFHVKGKKDTMHAFNSAVVAAHALPGLGFPITDEYPTLIHSWSEFTRQAVTSTHADAPPKPDNQKLPEILSGIDRLFREKSPASFIIKTVLLHISLNVNKNYPAPAPLTDDEIPRLIDPDLLTLLKVMMLSDNEGWSLFDPETRKQQRNDTLTTFNRFQALVDGEK